MDTIEPTDEQKSQGSHSDDESAAPSIANGRDESGKFTAGNQAARQTGAYAQYQPLDVRELADEFMAAVLNDIGEDEPLSTLQRAYVRRLGDVGVLLDVLAHDMKQRGIFTPAGGTRRVVEHYLQAIDRWDRLAQRIGTKPRFKRVPTLMEVLTRD
jgi:hypothetical protein